MIGLGAQLRHLVALLDGGVQQTYDRVGVNFRPRFYPVVRLLLEQGSASVGEVAAATGVSQPAATQTINEMRKLGLLDKEPGRDRRQHRFRLSAQGQDVSRQLREVWEATHGAARRLDAEIPPGLEHIVREAIAALQRHGFADRIAMEMKAK